MDKVELLYDHYKETFSRIKKTLEDRNRFFVMVFIVMTLQFLLATTPESISTLLIAVIYKQYEINIINQITLLQSLFWLILLYLTMRYYQINVYVERQYNYIHSLESDIESYAKITFNRESGDYLSNYPKMNSFMDMLYKWVFPLIFCFVISCKILYEIMYFTSFWLLLCDITLFCILFVLTILYLCFLHPKLSKIFRIKGRHN